MLTIKIIGVGCERCNQLEREVVNALTELNIMADVQHDRDIKKHQLYKLFGTPVLKINGKVKSVGKVPSRGEIKEWIKSPVEKRLQLNLWQKTLFASHH